MGLIEKNRALPLELDAERSFEPRHPHRLSVLLTTEVALPKGLGV